MRWYTIKITFVSVLLLLGVNCYALESTTDAEGYRNVWSKLIPRYGKVHFAGSIGLMSFGTGWDYCKHKLETDIFLGFVPKFSDTRGKTTFTLKQNYLPWNIYLSDRWAFEPLNCGLFVNTLLSSEYWRHEPYKYPGNRYYGFSTKVRFHIFMGQRFTLKLNRNGMKSVAGYYEISSCDLYIISAATNKYLKPKDYLSLSFGIKLQIL